MGKNGFWPFLIALSIVFSPHIFSSAASGQRIFVATDDGGPDKSFKLTSSSFANGGDIPKEFTCSGDDVSPALTWSGAPVGAKSFALIADDPDAPDGTWTHWLLYGLSPQTASLPENMPKTDDVPGGGKQGRNDFGKIGYGGPCPPPGKPHRYFFRLYALDKLLNLNAGASRRDLEQSMKGHILGEAEVMGKFGR